MMPIESITRGYLTGSGEILADCSSRYQEILTILTS